jgi:hypothetical protein
MSSIITQKHPPRWRYIYKRLTASSSVQRLYRYRSHVRVLVLSTETTSKMNGEELVNGTSSPTDVEDNNNKENVVEKGDVENTKETSSSSSSSSTTAADDKKATTNGTSSDKDEQEVVFIQDMGFTVKIVSPGTEAFDIQVSI